MQLELALSEHPATASMLWLQLDPDARQAVIDRLAHVLAKAAALPRPEESGDD